MEHSGTVIIFLVVIAIIILIYVWPKKTTSSPAPAPPASMMWRGPMSGNMFARRAPALLPSMSAYKSSGFMNPNTYTFTTANPRFGATMGAIPDNLQAVQAAVTNWTGSFIPNEQRNPSC